MDINTLVLTEEEMALIRSGLDWAQYHEGITRYNPDGLEETISLAIVKKAEPLIRQDERERVMRLALQSIADEVEYPSDMPDELWQRLNGNRDNVLKAMRSTVRLTKNGIVDRFLEALKATVEKED